MKYSITLYNRWKHPYFYTEDKEMCLNTESSTYETDKLELCITIIRDFLDVPEAKMTLKDVKKQFDDPRMNIKEENFKNIQNYYNGRLKLFKKISNEIEEALAESKPIALRYDLPYELNHFNVIDQECDEVQVEAYLRVEIS